MADKRSINYSKWDNLETSDDDEKDCHPNIDINMWKRLKREKRQTEVAELEKEKQALLAGPDKDTEKTKKRLKQIQNRQFELDPQLMCTVTSERTFVNKKELMKQEQEVVVESKKNDDEKEDDYKTFVEKNSALLDKFASLTLSASEEWLMEHHKLLHENSTGYMLLKMLDLEMAGKTKAMTAIARQYLVMQNILDLAKQIKSDPRATIKPFFVRINEAEHKARLADEVVNFTQKIKERAVVKKQEREKELAEAEAERLQALASDEENHLSREERLGPGGLDPLEVMETLPKAMQDAFESRDIKKLQDCIKLLPAEEMKYHLQRCQDSGLWVPGKSEEAGDPE